MNEPIDIVREQLKVIDETGNTEDGVFHAYRAGHYKDFEEAIADRQIREMLYHNDGKDVYVSIDFSLVQTLKRNIDTSITAWINQAVRERLKAKKIKEIT